jgi:ATP-binding cassette subfamily F protein 3
VLSGGEKSRVSLGKLLLSPHHVLLLDEPTNHLDMESTDALCNALEDFDGAIVIISHNEDILRRLTNKLVVFDGGETRPYELPYGVFLDEIGWKSERKRYHSKAGISEAKGNKTEYRSKRNKKTPSANRA